MENNDNQISGFTFFRNYYDIVDNLPEADKQKMLVAIMDYVFKDKEPELDGLLLAIFNMVKMGLDVSKNRAGNARNRGKKTSQNENEIKSKTNENQKEIKKKSNDKRKSNSDLSLSISISNSISNSNLEKEGVGEKTFLEKPKNSEIEKAVVDEWNKVGLACVKTLSKTRKDKIRLRVQELGLERVLEAIKRISRSRFLMGDNKQHWTCSFDWLFTNDSNIVKVLEGNYEDHDVGMATSNPFLKSMLNDRRNEEE